MIDVEEVVREARESMAGDSKHWATEEETIAFIAAGATVIKNGETEGKMYVIEFIYKGIRFIHASRDPLIPTNPILH